MDIKKVNQQLNLLEPVVKRVRYGRLQTDGPFICILKAAFSKCFTFVQLVYGNEAIQQAFFLNPSLRGICEDIIGLRYLTKFVSTDQEKVVDLLIKREISDFVGKQVNFFEKYNPNQIIIGRGDIRQEKKRLTEELANFRGRYQWKSRKTWPTIREMAEDGNLINLYEYLYAAASSFVHFSPRNLGRMGWGDIINQEFEFTTDNFCNYYDAFNKFYGVFLLVTFCTLFSSKLNCREEVQPKIEQLIQELRNSTWPELVTFDEINWGKMSPMARIVSPYDCVGEPQYKKLPEITWEWA